MIQRHWLKKQNRSGQRGQINRGGRGTCVGVTGRTYAGDSRDNIIISSSKRYFSLKLDFLLSAIRTSLIMDVATAATPIVAALSLIALSLVIRTAGFAPR